ncbi:hypothetical protein N7G274_004928 [Stereocaulon virgatum]|uniref:Uncharacterized protein n=1 Tax=Stereocaulon virgatum TaxID=373712 RepID=A0ABR4AC40_9LECA
MTYLQPCQRVQCQRHVTLTPSLDHDGYNNSSVAAPASFHNEAEEMYVTGQWDGLSEYGSDFTPDEEEILIGLLQQEPLSSSSATTIPDLQLRDIEDNEAPRGAKVFRRLGHERRGYAVGNMQPAVQEKRRVTIQIDGDSSLPTNPYS